MFGDVLIIKTILYNIIKTKKKKKSKYKQKFMDSWSPDVTVKFNGKKII